MLKFEMDAPKSPLADFRFLCFTAFSPVAETYLIRSNLYSRLTPTGGWIETTA
jgi:hypothetical protein